MRVPRPRAVTERSAPGGGPRSGPAGAAPIPAAPLTAEEPRVVHGPGEEARVSHAEHVPAVEAHELLPLLKPADVHQVPATHGAAPSAARPGPLPQASRP